MTEIFVIVINVNGDKVFRETLSNNIFLNYVYTSLGQSYLDCKIKLLYNGQIISPLKKICDITPDLIIIFDLLAYPELHEIGTQNVYQDLSIAPEGIGELLIVNSKGKIIKDPYNSFLNYYDFQCFIDKNYNSLKIISIISISSCYVTLFEDGMLIIYCCENNTIINTFYNILEIVSSNELLIIINTNNKLIIYQKNHIIINSNKLNNLELKKIYVIKNFIFIINNTDITIVQIDIENNNELLIIKHEINNIDRLYVMTLEKSSYNNSCSQIILAITENYTLISFTLCFNYVSQILSIQPLEDINNQLLKIKKILIIRNNSSFIVLTYNDTIYIWSQHVKLLEFYKEYQHTLVNIEDIVISDEAIGILKKDNTILLIEMYNYESFTITMYESTDMLYQKIITIIDKLFILTDNNKVLLLKKDGNPKEILNNIKKICNSPFYILAVSYDNIVYVYDTTCETVKFITQYDNLRTITCNNYMTIILNDGHVIIISFDKYYTLITHKLKDVVKFIKV